MSTCCACRARPVCRLTDPSPPSGRGRPAARIQSGLAAPADSKDLHACRHQPPRQAPSQRTPANPASRGLVLRTLTRASRAARVSGRLATASRSTRTSGSRRTTTGCNVRSAILDIYSKAGLRLDRRLRPARPDPLDGALHPAPARHRRRQDRGARAGGARRPVLHAAGPDRRRAAEHRAAARDRGTSLPTYARDTADVTDRQNIQLHWIRDRGRARRSGTRSRRSG